MNYTIHDFMTEQLQLSGTELLLYALVYNFSQDGNGCFYGSNDYAAKKVGCTRVNVNDKLSRLVKRGLLSRSYGSHNGKPTIDYVAIVPEVCQDSVQCKESLHQMSRKLTDGCDESLHNNQSDNLNDNQTSVVNNARTKQKIHFAEFVTMTEEEHQKLVDEFGEADTAALIQILDNYKGSKDVKYKSDYRAIRSWCVDRLEEHKRKTSQRFGYQQPPVIGPRVNERGETPTVASMRAAAESFGRIAARHAAAPAGVDVIPAPIDEQDQIDD